jgi:hypothetical protein
MVQLKLDGATEKGGTINPSSLKRLTMAFKSRKEVKRGKISGEGEIIGKIL